MNQTAQATKWHGDCVITREDEGQTLLLDFRDLRAQKFAALRELLPNNSVPGEAASWQDVFSSIWVTFDRLFYKEWFHSSGQGDNHIIWIKVRADRSADELLLLVQQYLETHADIVVNTA